MSRTIELAKECGMPVAPSGNGYWDNEKQLQAYYDAAWDDAIKQIISSHSFFHHEGGTWLRLSIEKMKKGGE